MSSVALVVNTFIQFPILILLLLINPQIDLLFLLNNIFLDDKFKYVSLPRTDTMNNIEDDSNGGPAFFQLSETRLYTVCGIIAALLLVAIIQITCTMYKTRKTNKNQKVIFKNTLNNTIFCSPIQF